MQKALRSLKRYWPLYLMLLPGTVYLLINNYIPMTGIAVAFKQYNVRDGLYHSPNIGLKNFEFLFKTSDAWLITRNTVLYNLVFIILGAVQQTRKADVSDHYFDSVPDFNGGGQLPCLCIP